MSGPVIGFDLDLTLVDTRPGIATTYRMLAVETGVPIDYEAAASRLGPPLSVEMNRWFPPERVPAMSDRYRELYPDHAVAPSPAVAGAIEAVDAVRAAGGQVLVISAKYAAHVQLHLDHVGIVADHVIGWAFGDGKRDALREYGAWAYVGDFSADMSAARDAGVFAVGVTTGFTTADELRAAGADVVLDGLGDFPALLPSLLAMEPREGSFP